MSGSTRLAPPAAVVGLGALFPGRVGTNGFWKDILSLADNIREVPSTHWLIEDYYDPDPKAEDKTYCKRGGFIDPVAFDPVAFGMPPTTLPATDTAQMLALIVARQVLEDARQALHGAIDQDRISVILGVASATELAVHLGSRLQRPVWIKALRESGLPETQVREIAERMASHYVPWQESSFPGLLGNVVAGRIANRLNLGGSNFVTDAACASSLSAVQCALNELALGQSDLVLTGGVDALNDILMYMCFSKTPAFSPTGDCRPFADSADGTVIGEGAGMLALRRLEDAERDGNRIYAVLRGLGASSDGRSKSVYAPRPEGQASAIRRAYEAAGYGPGTVGLIEAHGTATRAGDVAEFGALCAAFAPDGGNGRQWCALGSVKSQIGHTKAAAGAAGLMKAVLALHNKVLPPTAKVERPNPELDLANSPFYLPTRALPWIRPSGHLRRAGVSSFGFGGSNFHVTLEEYSGPAPRPERHRAMAGELFTLSAATSHGLVGECRALAGRCEGATGFSALARETQLAFEPDAGHRLAIVATSVADLSEKTARAAAALDSNERRDLSGPDIFFGDGPAQRGKMAFLFPGQGSQYVYMGADVAIAFDEARAVWDDAAANPVFAVAPLHALVFPPPVFAAEDRAARAAALTRMANAQPAIAAVSLSHLALLRAVGLRADAVAGHSFGEVMALHAAGVFNANTALMIAARRGALMTEAAGNTASGMTAVAASGEEVEKLLAGAVQGIVLANDNSPRQAVLSGPLDALAEAEAILKQAGNATQRLAVAAAFHSPVVAASVQPFAGFLDGVEVAKPVIPAYANSTATPYPGDAGTIRKTLAEQIAKPVRFRQTIERLAEAGVDLFIEVGPGGALTGLVDQCLAGRPHAAIALDSKGSDGILSLWRAFARLSSLGVHLDFAPLWRNLPAEPPVAAAPAHAVMITGANLGKPYPPRQGVAAVPPPNPEVARQTIDPTSVASDRHTEGVAALHHDIAEAHHHFMQAMTDAHLAYLRAAETILGGDTPTSGASADLRSAMPPAGDPVLPPSEFMAPPSVILAAPAAAVREKQPFVPMPEAPATAPPDIAGLMIEVVAEKTGYPADMLSLDMELEADLSVDSIKQVEILSALRERLPSMPEIEPARMAELKSLRSVVAFIKEAAPVPGRPFVVRAPEACTPATMPSTVAMAPGYVGAVLLAVVAEKTGYPIDMLSLDMELEADLSVDSIKQVEILSALRERLPSMQDVEPKALSALRTLRSLADFMSSSPDDPVPPATTAGPDAVVARPPGSQPSSITVCRYLAAASAPRSGFALAGLSTAKRIAVAPESDPLAPALVAALRSAGIAAEACAEPTSGHDGVIVLAPTSTGIDTALAAQRRTLAWARTLAPRFASIGGVFVTVQDTGGSFGISRTPGDQGWIGGLPGLVKTAALEWPQASVKAIDLDRANGDLETLARQLANELLQGGPEIEVGIDRDGRRVSLVLTGHPAPDSCELSLVDGDVVLVSGGGRGVTAHAIRRLAAARRLRFAIFGRSVLREEQAYLASARTPAEILQAMLASARSEGRAPRPAEIDQLVASVIAAREIRETLAAIAAAGSEARYIALDIADTCKVDEAVSDVRRQWGPAAAVVHGAGVLADKAIADKSDAQFDHVMRPKVGGLHALLEATRADPLKVICLFSSAAARTGNAGQADYAMANEILNKVAQAEARRRGSACRVVAINWGPWDGGMVNDSLRRHFARRGIGLIGLDDGSRIFMRELARRPGMDAVEIVAGDGFNHMAAPRTMEIRVDSTSQPFLSDHMIDGRIVLPAVLVIEWFMRAAKALLPGLHPAALRGLHVLKSVSLRSAGDPEILVIRAVPGQTGGAPTLDMSLESRGAVHYRGTVVLATTPNPASAPEPSQHDADGSGWPWQADEIYGRQLFHGPSFQVIETLQTLSDSGGSGTLRPAPAAHWPGGPWFTQPAILDGGMQLALLWGRAKANRMFLPMRIGEFVPYDGHVNGDALQCNFTSRLIDPLRTESELSIAGSDGSVLARLTGIEMYAVGITATSGDD